MHAGTHFLRIFSHVSLKLWHPSHQCAAAVDSAVLLPIERSVNAGAVRLAGEAAYKSSKFFDY